MNTPEKSTKSEDINEYTLNRFVDTTSLALAKLNALKCSTFAFEALLTHWIICQNNF